jgi:2-dehydro-3-deoxyphosphogluconate aldolase / (4S)-4-hydroxy-2-oxoglutarate aldolase
MKAQVLGKIKKGKIVAIIRGIKRSHILPTVEALKNGGVDCIEVTFNTPNAKEMISDVCNHFNTVTVGAGTVLDVETAKKAVNAGAKFILSPSLHKDVIEFCNQNNIVSIPGAYTPTEVVQAGRYGADIVKVFPAGTNAEYIKMIRGPIDNINMMAVGGVNIDNIENFFNAGCMSVGVGGSLVKTEFIENGDFDKLTELSILFKNKVNKL